MPKCLILQCNIQPVLIIFRRFAHAICVVCWRTRYSLASLADTISLHYKGEVRCTWSELLISGKACQRDVFRWDTNRTWGTVTCVALHSNLGLHQSWNFLPLKVFCTSSSVFIFIVWRWHWIAGTLEPCASMPDTKRCTFCMHCQVPWKRNAMISDVLGMRTTFNFHLEWTMHYLTFMQFLLVSFVSK